MGNKQTEPESEKIIEQPISIENYNYEKGMTLLEIHKDRCHFELLKQKGHRCLEISEEFPYRLIWCEEHYECIKIAREEYCYEKYLQKK
jgi:hypothetical protein